MTELLCLFRSRIHIRRAIYNWRITNTINFLIIDSDYRLNHPVLIALRISPHPQFCDLFRYRLSSWCLYWDNRIGMAWWMMQLEMDCTIMLCGVRRTMSKFWPASVCVHLHVYRYIPFVTFHLIFDFSSDPLLHLSALNTRISRFLSQANAHLSKSGQTAFSTLHIFGSSTPPQSISISISVTPFFFAQGMCLIKSLFLDIGDATIALLQRFFDSPR